MNKLLTLGLALAATASASAQFVRLEVDYIDNMGKVPGDTYRVYAVMENEGDILDAVYGEASAALKVSSTKPFYQHPKGGALSADIQRYDTTLDETLLYDSWVTIGAEDNYMNAVSGFIMEDALAVFDQGNELATNEAHGLSHLTSVRRLQVLRSAFCSCNSPHKARFQDSSTSTAAPRLCWTAKAIPSGT